MDRFEFGILIASLRNDLNWTHMDLSSHSGVSIPAIKKIEEGERKELLKDDVLLKLADGFHLTSMERMEFLFAASGVSEIEKTHKDNPRASDQFDAPAFLKEMGAHIASISLPAFVTDAFCDVLMVNRSLIEFYGLPMDLLRSTGDRIGGYNSMRYLFDAQSDYPQKLDKENFKSLALIHVRYFRRRTMRVRSKQYFRDLMAELMDNKKHPYFEKYWKMVLDEDLDDNSLLIQRPAPDFDHAYVEVESLFALTPHGELYLRQALPLNRKTAELVENISKTVGGGYELFAPCPDERKL